MKRLLTILLACAGLAACETTGGGGPTMPPVPPPSNEFRAQDFAWSTVPGQNRVDGALVMRVGQTRYTCTGSTVILMPETPWTHRRVEVLYGSATSATVPVETVRARTPPSPPEFGRYVRSSACVADRFTFTALADGAWYIITLARPPMPGGQQVAVMRRVETRGGRPTQVVMGS